ncbi:MAG: hypothetical protein EXR61_03010 [Chloroflexi bacterium]|nr:hypothetical protein [Chloroflexota bacterium]
MKIWTIGAKVADLDAEIAFIEAMGGSLIVDDRIAYEGQVHRIPLLKWGDKYLHLGRQMVYEGKLAAPLQNGLCHVVFQVAEIEEPRRRALRAGASEIAPPSRVEAGFGIRDVAFLRSPGGTLFELVRIVEDRVPALP